MYTALDKHLIDQQQRMKDVFAEYDSDKSGYVTFLFVSRVSKFLKYSKGAVILFKKKKKHLHENF